MVGMEGLMAIDLEARLFAAENRIAALQDLLICHVVALERFLAGSTDSTVRIAEAARTGAIDHGDNAAADALSTLLDHLRAIGSLAINDR